VVFGVDILRRRSPKRVSVVEFSTAERVANGELFTTADRVMRTGNFFGIRAGEAKTERNCGSRQRGRRRPVGRVIFLASSSQWHFSGPFLGYSGSDEPQDFRSGTKRQ
jgi:hypothetical protein